MRRGPQISLLALLPLALSATLGCHVVLPETSQQPVVHNPFPQLSRVAVVPFFNQSADATINGREFAMAYFAALQSVPGYEVVPVSAVEAVMQQAGVTFGPPEPPVQQARRLAKALGVDAVVIGTVTDFSPYYPPRCGMRVEWYAANQGFHEIPAGYGLPWGTPEEEYIPDRLVFEAEMALARAQLETQSPIVDPSAIIRPALEPIGSEPKLDPTPLREGQGVDDLEDPFFDDPLQPRRDDGGPPAAESLPAPTEEAPAPNPLRAASFEAPMNGPTPPGAATTPANLPPGMTDATGMTPPGWPDARGFTPAGPSPVRPVAPPNPGPVMTHTRVFRGTDTDFTAALAGYVGFRDDARQGGWQSYLSRSEDFIRFCCHLHVVEMLTARGGGGETRVVRRWSPSR